MFDFSGLATALASEENFGEVIGVVDANSVERQVRASIVRYMDELTPDAPGGLRVPRARVTVQDDAVLGIPLDDLDVARWKLRFSLQRGEAAKLLPISRMAPSPAGIIVLEVG